MMAEAGKVSEDISNSELLKKLLDVIGKESERIRAELKEEIHRENLKLHGRVESCFAKLDVLEKKQREAENKCKGFERHIRKNNVLIYGLDIQEYPDLVSVVLDKIRQLLDVDINVSEINNLYPIRTGNKEAIKIEFVSCLKKKIILENCHKLKGTNIFFVQDLCYEDRQDRRTLRRHLNIARSKNYFARIQGRTLIVNNEKYTIEQLNDLDSEENSNPSDFIGSPLKGPKSKSAPHTPSTGQAYFEDSLHLFSLNTPVENCKEPPENIIQDRKHRGGPNEEANKVQEEAQQRLDEGKEGSLVRNILQGKKLEDKKKKIYTPKTGSNSSPSFTSRVVTRQNIKK